MEPLTQSLESSQLGYIHKTIDERVSKQNSKRQKEKLHNKFACIQSFSTSFVSAIFRRVHTKSHSLSPPRLFHPMTLIRWIVSTEKLRSCEWPSAFIMDHHLHLYLKMVSVLSRSFFMPSAQFCDSDSGLCRIF